MRNILKLLRRDFRRLLKAPAALIVLGALLVLPSIYTWYNVVAFWDPYNSTSGLKVCVVNQDKGAENDATGPLKVGDTVTEALLSNEQLTWVEGEYDTAMDDLKAGGVYAVYVIPEDFTECLISPLTGQVKHPKLQYYANEKLGPVSPKITDMAASALDQTINSLFVSTVTEKAVDAVERAMEKAEADVGATRSEATERADMARAAVAEARDSLGAISSAMGEARGKVDSTVSSLDDASVLVSDAQAVLRDVSSEAEAVQSSLSELSTRNVAALSTALAKVSNATGEASQTASSLALATSSARDRVSMATARSQLVIDALHDAAMNFQKAADALPDGSKAKDLLANAAQKMESRSAALQSLVDEAELLGDKVEGASQAVADTAKALDESVSQASSSLEGYSDSLYGTVAPEVNASIAQVGVVSNRLSSAVESLYGLVQQTKPLLRQTSGILRDCGNAVDETNGLVGSVQEDLDSVMTDARLLAQSGTLQDLVKNGSLNSKSIAEFMGAPTELNTVELYHPNAYGASMAPLFMNLTFWIGAFMLVIIFRLEVDSEGVEKLTLGQRYLSRLGLFCLFAVVQALICCAGTLALGVQAANVPALFLGAAVASLAYTSLIYALSSTFKHIGKALCIVLVFAQIPGGSGLYPLELTSSFFQSIYPFLPFSYGIDIMREAIGGFYDGHFLGDLVALGAFFFGSMAFGLLCTPLISNVARMGAKQIREGDLYNGEDVLTPERPYRLTQVLRALSEKNEYRDELNGRYERFKRRYPIFIRASIVLGVGVPVVLVLLVALNVTEKVYLLTAFVLWLVGLFVFLTFVESYRFSLQRQLGLGTMSERAMLNIFVNRNHLASDSEGAVTRPDAPPASSSGAPADAIAPAEAPSGPPSSSDASDASDASVAPAEPAARMVERADELPEVPAESEARDA